MIHTAKFMVLLQEVEIGLLCKRFKEKITLIGNQLNDEFYGISTSFKSLFNVWRMDIHVDFIKLIGKADIQESDIKTIQT